MEEPVEPRDVPAGAKELGVVVDETVRVLSHAFEQLDSLVAAQEAMVCPKCFDGAKWVALPKNM